ncbi:YeiH family protein [Nitrosomonas communis]|uniref:YeiH family protein n=1 Tax=Nitrosomonas communis TaxID=44574 RepID=UPI0026EA3CC7|nr:putative sulfate exporter family transporter [Nitrosomonas communis]MCO6427362.1 putative sulfate exporter family transporter [Nitrosomonas communis]
MTKHHQQPFFKTEDFWAIIIGSFLLLAGLAIYFSLLSADLKQKIAETSAIIQSEAGKPIKTVAWHEATAELAKLKLSEDPIGKFLKNLTTLPNKWSNNPIEAFYKPATPADMAAETNALALAREQALVAELAAQTVDFKIETLNSSAQSAIEQWQQLLSETEKKKAKLKAGAFSLPHIILLFGFLAVLFGIGAKVQGIPFKQFAQGFVPVFLLSLISLFLAAQNDFKDFGIEYAIWAILLGIIISNTIGTPGWATSALQTEFFIKTGLVLMGAELMIGKILAIGLPGIFVAWIVTPIVLVTTYWFGQNILKIASKSLNITISADMSVCGVSAAIATAAASKASREELTVAISLSMVFTAIMMVVMPLFVKFTGMPEVLGGAWIGGTVDSSGAVVAAGAALGEKAMYVATTIKMIQNMLIGLVAFCVAIYFATKVEKDAQAPQIGIGEIWHRFPKFILGFIGASVLFSILYASLDKHIANLVLENGILSDFTRNLRTWFFCLAFASIGLSTNFKTLKHHFVGGKPLILYVCGQLLNLLLTLGAAYLMFYIVFPEITAMI